MCFTSGSFVYIFIYLLPTVVILVILCFGMSKDLSIYNFDLNMSSRWHTTDQALPRTVGFMDGIKNTTLERCFFWRSLATTLRRVMHRPSMCWTW